MRLSKWSSLALIQIAILILPITGMILSDDPLGYAASTFALLLGVASLCFIAYSRRRSMPVEDKRYMWRWARPGDYIGTRLMWIVEQAAVNMLGFVQQRALKRDLKWAVIRVSEGTRAMSAVVEAQRTEAQMLKLLGATGIGEALAKMSEVMKDGFGQGRMQEAAMAERENESKMKFDTVKREQRLRGRNYVTRLARDARRELGLPPQ